MTRAYITRPALIMYVMAGTLIFFVILASTTNAPAVYTACVLGQTFYSVYFIPFWAWRSATLQGATGTAFTLGFQSSIGQIGGVIGPQLFRQKYAYIGYKTPFAICAAAIGASWIANCWTWWLTKEVEEDVLRVRRERIRAGRSGEVYVGDDVLVDTGRGFHDEK